MLQVKKKLQIEEFYAENACPEKELEKVFNDNEDALVKLFGSPQQAKTKVILPILEGTKSYWTYDQAFYSIEQALDPTSENTFCNLILQLR